MSHVDKGALHAYLDGALDEYPAADAARIREHLDGCAECVDRLAAERKVRSEAAAMLGLAAPDVEMPSLEDLRAYVKATRPKRTPAAVRMYRLGWAASMVLAVGAGWWVRDGQLQPPQVFGVGDFEDRSLRLQPARMPDGLNETIGSLDAQAVAPADGPEADADEVAPTAGSIEGDPPSQSIARLSEYREAPSTDASAVAKITAQPTEESIVPPEEGVAPAARRNFEAEAARERVAEVAAIGAAVAGDPAADLMRELQASPLAALESPLMEPLDAVAGGGTASDVVAELSVDDRVAESVLDGTAASRGAASNEPEVDDGRGADPRRAESRVAVTLNQRADFQNRSVAEDERVVADERSWIVPGYGVAGVSNIGEGTSHAGVHWVQKEVGSGNTIDVFHLEPDVDPAVVPAPADGRNEIRAEVDDGWIIIQARLTDEELRELLSKLVAEGLPRSRL